MHAVFILDPNVMTRNLGKFLKKSELYKTDPYTNHLCVFRNVCKDQGSDMSRFLKDYLGKEKEKKDFERRKRENTLDNC